MPNVTRPTLPTTLDRATREAIGYLQDAVDQLLATNADLQAKVANLPAPLSLAAISAGLSAQGSNPLNITGLVGTPAPAPK